MSVHATLERVRLNFLRWDSVLLTHKAHERTVTHRIAIYLQIAYPQYHVDCEYNRQGMGTTSKTDSAGKRRFPDVIVHKRTRISEDNLLVIEAKPVWASNARKNDDRDKLRRMVETFNYQHAYLAGYSSGEAPDLWFERIHPAGLS